MKSAQGATKFKVLMIQTNAPFQRQDAKISGAPYENAGTRKIQGLGLLWFRRGLDVW
jgi:hypothetical protein